MYVCILNSLASYIFLIILCFFNLMFLFRSYTSIHIYIYIAVARAWPTIHIYILYICIRIYVYTYIYEYVYVCIYICIYIYNTHTDTHTHTNTHTYIHVYIDMYLLALANKVAPLERPILIQHSERHNALLTELRLVTAEDKLNACDPS